MSDALDDFPPINELENDRQRHRRHAMARLVKILVDVSSGLNDPQDAKHRAEIKQLRIWISAARMVPPCASAVSEGSLAG